MVTICLEKPSAVVCRDINMKVWSTIECTRRRRGRNCKLCRSEMIVLLDDTKTRNGHSEVNIYIYFEI